MFEADEDNPLQIGRLAKSGGVSVETVRYYERIGLLEPAERGGSSGYRSFPAEALRRLHFIRRAKNLGFSLAEIGELLELRVLPEARAADVRLKVEEKLVDVRQKIDDLERIGRTLERLAESCDGRGGIEDCVILGALEEPSSR